MAPFTSQKSPVMLLPVSLQEVLQLSFCHPVRTPAPRFPFLHTLSVACSGLQFCPRSA